MEHHLFNDVRSGRSGNKNVLHLLRGELFALGGIDFVNGCMELDLVLICILENTNTISPHDKRTIILIANCEKGIAVVRPRSNVIVEFIFFFLFLFLIFAFRICFQL